MKFLLPRNDPKWEYITDAYYLRVESKEFALVGTDEERDNTGKLITNVQYEENYLELAGYVGDYLTVEILNTDAGSALTSLLFGKPWSVGQVTVPNTRLRDLVTEKESLLFNLRKVQELWGGYLVFDSINRSVSLFETYGQDNGVQFRYRKNLKSVRKTTDFAGVVTRLYPFGKDGLDISSVEPGGNKYIEDFSYTSRVREGIWVDQQYTDAAKLYEAAQEVLAEIAQPRVSYAVSIVDLSHLTGYEHESFKLGDWVTVIDEELGINVKAQIVKRTYDVLQPWRGPVELANFRPGITDLITEAVKSSRIVGQAVLPNKKISTNALQGYINTATNQINSPNSRLKWDDTGIIAEEVDEQGQPTGKIVKITSGGVGISNDGGLTFHVAMTGDGVLANRVVVNDIYALSTEDGFTKMKAAGIEVWDNSSPPKKRVHLGQYEAGKFGLEVKAQDGQTVLLDEQGLMQSWQDSKADNLDNSNPLLLNLYLPPETRSIKRALLRFK
ncbi:MAG: phage tail protein, partial [Desulfitobacteriaceae bacterium]|nr:phage tail protein [Desulfitobacteriaceae bacterium]